MATLKNLVDETTNIKNELVTCNTNLKNNLITKGVEVTSQDKMSNLIDKIRDIEVEKHNIPIWYDMQYKSYVGTSISFTPVHHTCVLVDDDVYVMGGFSDNYQRPYDKHECYNIKKNTVTIKAVLPNGSSSRNMGGACVIGKRIYYFGGGTYIYGEGGKLFSDMQCYDTITNTYETKSISYSARSNFGYFSIGNNIYMMGGTMQVRYTVKDVLCYNTTLNVLTSKADMPTAKQGQTCIPVGDSVYCIGGYDRPNSDGDKYTNYNTVDIYNASLDTYTSSTPLPVVLCNFNSAYDNNNKIYILGGNKYTSSVYANSNLDPVRNANYIYDIKLKTWTDLPVVIGDYSRKSVYKDGLLYSLGSYGTKDPVLCTTL